MSDSLSNFITVTTVSIRYVTNIQDEEETDESTLDFSHILGKGRFFQIHKQILNLDERKRTKERRGPGC